LPKLPIGWKFDRRPKSIPRSASSILANLAGTLGFGFLLLFFAAGLALAVHRSIRAFAERGGGKVDSATH
jgi:hypothetical protein